MRLTRQKTWLALQGLVLLIAGLYQLMWLGFGVNTTGQVVEFYRGTREFPANFIVVEYYAAEKPHFVTFIHDEDFDANFIGQEIKLSYLSFARDSARLPRFTTGDRIVLVFYGIFLFVTALIFLMPNYLIGRQSQFIITARPPFIRYLSGKAVSRGETVRRIINANLVAGYIEKFMMPFVGSAVIALFIYISTFEPALVIASFAVGTVLGVIRAYQWKKELKPNDEELTTLDYLPGNDDETEDVVVTRDSQ